MDSPDAVHSSARRRKGAASPGSAHLQPAFRDLVAQPDRGGNPGRAEARVEEDAGCTGGKAAGAGVSVRKRGEETARLVAS